MSKSIFFRLVFYALMLALPCYSSCSDTDDDKASTESSGANVNKNDTSKEPALARLEFPKVKGGNSLVLIHSTNDSYGINYSVEWDSDKQSQRWSCYQMTSETLAKNTTRFNDGYLPDPLLPSNPDLIKGNGFDHGHICPSADRLYSADANMQTFYLTNMQPQYAAFNGSLRDNEAYKNNWSPWYRLESQVRTWANASATEVLYVVKGGTIEDNQLLTKKGELRVPKYYFVALLLKNAQGYKAVGFWMEHQSSYASKLELSSYAVNIRTLEQNTGIDFFCNLPDDIEERVETLPKENIINAWSLKGL
jgi:endonuclease G